MGRLLCSRAAAGSGSANRAELLDADPDTDPMEYQTDLSILKNAIDNGDYWWNYTTRPLDFLPGQEPDQPTSGLSGLADLYDDFSAAMTGDRQSFHKQWAAFNALETFSLNVDPADVYIIEYADPSRYADENGDLVNCPSPENGFYQILDLGPLWNIFFAQAELDTYKAWWMRNNLCKPMNEEIRAAAVEHGWTYVGGIADLCRPHGFAGTLPYDPEYYPGYDYLNRDGWGAWPTSWDYFVSEYANSGDRWFRQPWESLTIQGSAEPPTWLVPFSAASGCRISGRSRTPEAWLTPTNSGIRRLCTACCNTWTCPNPCSTSTGRTTTATN